MPRVINLLLLAGLVMLNACAASPYGVRPGQSFRDCRDCPELVAVPPGTFQMGSDHVEPMRGGEQRPEGPVRTVTIAKPFAAGKFEVTNAEFSVFLKSGYMPAAGCQTWAGVEVVQGKTWKDPDYGRAPLPRDPVVCVTWRDAKAYAAWLTKVSGKNYRLLSEAEWEYAARGGATTTWPWGENAIDICLYGNSLDLTGLKEPRMTSEVINSVNPADLCDDHFGAVAPVGSFKPNSFGLYDMVGNVWEWIEDCSQTMYPSAPVDGGAVEVPGACEKRANHGGSWRTRISRQRPSFRGRDPELTASQIFGFRVARDL